MECYWQGKAEELGENPVPVPIFSPQIPHGLSRKQTSGLRVEIQATNRLSHGMAFVPWFLDDWAVCVFSKDGRSMNYAPDEKSISYGLKNQNM
jgi:hypothetical protein